MGSLGRRSGSWWRATGEKEFLPVNFQLIEGDESAISVWPVRVADLEAWLAEQPESVAAWVTAADFKAKADSHLLVPGADGSPAGVVLGLGESANLWSAAGLPKSLPAGQYRFAPEPEAEDAARFALSWALGAYRFTRYKEDKDSDRAELVWPAAADRQGIERAARATWLVRDLVNTPAADLGPAELAEAAASLATEHGASCETISGEHLLAQGYPAIHAVGVLRFGRPRPQDRRRHAPDEEGHGRRGHGARPCPHGDGRRAARAAPGAGAGGGQQRRRRRLPSG
jgi:leucyl aminopeptidase